MITITGRIPLWEQLLPYIAKHPIQGYGYDGFWTSRHIAEISHVQGWVVTQGHSVYIDLSLGLGVVGVVVYILMIIIGIIRAFAYHKLSCNAEYSFLVVALIFIALNGLLESIIIAANQITFITFLIIASMGFSRNKLYN
jgi:O-antigen ligase